MEPDRPISAISEGRNQVAVPFVVHDPYTVLRDANFRRLVLAGMVATVGNQMQGVAIGWELYERTSSPLALGMVGLAQVLPVILLAIPAGHAADRHSRKGLIILAHGLLLLATVGLALLSAWRGPVGLTYLFLVLTGVGQALNRPRAGRSFPRLCRVSSCCRPLPGTPVPGRLPRWRGRRWAVWSSPWPAVPRPATCSTPAARPS